MPSKKNALKVYMAPDEFEQIIASSERAGLSMSTFAKRVCLGASVPSLESEKFRNELRKAIADLGRLGGLFKLWLSMPDAPARSCGPRCGAFCARSRRGSAKYELSSPKVDRRYVVISRHIARKPENDNYRRLANYIADAAGRGEKCLLTWCAGCWMGENYAQAIDEVVDTQALNTRATKEKTYHLLVSFRPEDEATLTSSVLKLIEQDFAKALGLEEHQRHCAVHKNTNNLHLHVAYNLIHPEKLTRREPYRDFHTRDRLCRELEQRLALRVDNGRDHARENDATPLSDGAATVEAHTGQQSFESYVKEYRDDILAALEKASSWDDIHRALAKHGLTIKPHGNGLVIASRQGQHAIKASSLDRVFSKSNMEKRFGPYQAQGKGVEQLPPATTYNANPLHRAPERDDLYAEYQAGIAKRKAALTLIKEQEAIARETLTHTWTRKRQEIEGMAFTKRDKSNLLRHARRHEAEARMRLANNLTSRRKAIAEEVPFASWAEFLRGKAAQGNEVALAILRSRKQEVSPEPAAPAPKLGQRPAQGNFWRAQQRKSRPRNLCDRPTRRN